MGVYVDSYLEIGDGNSWQGFAKFEARKDTVLTQAIYQLEKRGLPPNPSFGYRNLRSWRVLDKPRTDGEEMFILRDKAEADVKRGIAEWWGLGDGKTEYIYYKVDFFLTWAYASELEQIYQHATEDISSLLYLNAIVSMMQTISDDKGSRLIIWTG